jgi:hypothetical protein
MAAALLTAAEERRVIALARRQPDSTEELAALLDRVRARVVEAVQNDERVRERLGRRSRLIGADYDEDKPDQDGRPTRLARVHFYDYDAGTALVAVVDLRTGELVALDERRGTHLRPSEEEVDEARQLVLRSELGARLAGRQVSVVAFPARSVPEENPASTHRRVELHVWSVDRLPERMLSAVVDLNEGAVLTYDEDRED